MKPVCSKCASRRAIRSKGRVGGSDSNTSTGNVGGWAGYAEPNPLNLPCVVAQATTQSASHATVTPRTQRSRQRISNAPASLFGGRRRRRRRTHAKGLGHFVDHILIPYLLAQAPEHGLRRAHLRFRLVGSYGCERDRQTRTALRPRAASAAAAAGSSRFQRRSLALPAQSSATSTRPRGPHQSPVVPCPRQSGLRRTTSPRG